MKNLRLLSFLGILGVFTGLMGMEEGVEEARKERESKAVSKVGALPQNIWTLMSEYLIDRKGKTKDEIFRITDLMFYPKVNQDPAKIVSKSLDKEKVAKQIALAKSLNNYIKTVGREKAINSYRDFKNYILIQIIDSRAKKAMNLPENSKKRLEDLKLDIALDLNVYDFYKTTLNTNYINERMDTALFDFDNPSYIKNMQKLLNSRIHPDDFIINNMSPLQNITYVGVAGDYILKSNISNNLVQMIKLLLQYGADPDFRTTIRSANQYIHEELQKAKNLSQTQGWLDWALRKSTLNSQRINVLENILKLFAQATQIRAEFLKNEKAKEKPESN